MSEWWTYTLSDFLLFSPRTYYRLLELYNLAIWPAQLAGVAIGCAIVALLVGKHRRRDRIIAGLLAVCWLWVAWAFHYQRYAQINWAAPWFAAAFAFQALLLVVLGILAGRSSFAPPIGREGWLAMTLARVRDPRVPVAGAADGASRGRPPRRSAWRPTRRRSRPSRCWRWSAGASDGCCWSFRYSGARSPRRRCGRWTHRRPLWSPGPRCLRCGRHCAGAGRSVDLHK